MSEDQGLVEEHESILRRIHKTYYDANLNTPIQPEAFRPTERDADGLSVFREKFVTPAELLMTVPEAKRNLYYIARLRVVDLKALWLTVVPRPVAGLTGHAVIPELNWHSYQKDRFRLKPVQLQLAKLASQDVVREPA